jgi:hypothetical protein
VEERDLFQDKKTRLELPELEGEKHSRLTLDVKHEN